MPETKNPQLTPELYAYVLEHNPPLDPVQEELVEITRTRFGDAAGMQSAREQGPLLAFLVRLTGARQVVEVGTFTGFSALSMAQALPADGRLIACDISEEWTAVAREAWAKAGVADRVDLRIAPALDTLRALPRDPWIDLVYLDADKGNYVNYWEKLVPRMRPAGSSPPTTRSSTDGSWTRAPPVTRRGSGRSTTASRPTGASRGCC